MHVHQTQVSEADDQGICIKAGTLPKRLGRGCRASWEQRLYVACAPCQRAANIAIEMRVTTNACAPNIGQ